MTATMNPRKFSSKIFPVPSRLAMTPPMTDPARPTLRFCFPA